MAEAHSAAEIPVRGIASGHLVDLSMHVKRYVKPLDEGKGPTRFTCTYTNLLNECELGGGGGGGISDERYLGGWRRMCERHGRRKGFGSVKGVL